MQKVLRILKKQRLAIFAGIGFGSVLYLGKYLVDLGSKGDHYAQTWGMIISLLSLLLSMGLGWQQLKHPVRSVRTAKVSEHSTLQTQLTGSHLAVILLVAVIAFTIPPLINRTAFERWQTEDVTSRVELKDAARLHNGDTARILLPASKHRNLSITVTLTSLVRTGSCVSPAYITLTPTHGGNDSKTTQPFQSGETQTIAVNQNVPVELRAAIDLSQETSCAVRLHVSYAQFRR